MTGKQIAEIVMKWVAENMPPDDFSMLFAEELIERVEESE
jgi:hypothetical protein